MDDASGGSPEPMDLSLHHSLTTESSEAPHNNRQRHRVWHFNVAFLGSCRAGKTKLLQRFVDSQFSDIYNATQETAFVSKSLAIGRHHVVFQCWDTPGSVRHSSYLDHRLAQLHAAFIVFDVSRDAVADLEHWHHVAMSHTIGDDAPPLLVLVANKTDLGCHQATMARARELCRRAPGGGLTFSLSVLADEENLEVDAMMLEVGKALTERRHVRSIVSPPTLTSQPQSVSSMPPAQGGDQPCHGEPNNPMETTTSPKQQFPGIKDAGEAVKGDGGASAKAETAADGGKSASIEADGGKKSWLWSRVCCCNCW